MNDKNKKNLKVKANQSWNPKKKKTRFLKCLVLEDGHVTDRFLFQNVASKEHFESPKMLAKYLQFAKSLQQNLHQSKRNQRKIIDRISEGFSLCIW